MMDALPCFKNCRKKIRLKKFRTRIWFREDSPAKPPPLVPESRSELDDREAAEIGKTVIETLDLEEEVTAELVRATLASMRQAQEIGEAVVDELDIEKEEATADSLRVTLASVQQQAQTAEVARVENKKLEKENIALRASLTAELSADNSADAADNLKSRVGCLPCWLGDGKPLYYFAYDINYRGGRYQISPHRNLQSGAPVVNDALEGEVRIIKNYPRGPISRKEFLAFGKKITAAQKRLYGDNQCKMAIRINDEADGKIIKFVRDQAGFCPIYR